VLPVLTDAECKSAKGRDRSFVLTDSNGLELLVTPKCTKIWRFRYTPPGGGCQKRITLGRYPLMPLAKARAAAGELRVRVWQGEDPASVIKKPAAVQDLGDVIDNYIENHRLAWKPNTERTYLAAIKVFLKWSKAAGIRQAHQVTPAALAAFRAHSLGLHRRVKASGSEGNQETVETDCRRSTVTVNGELRAIKAMLQRLRKTGHLPGLVGRDSIADTLHAAGREYPNPRPVPLQPQQLRDLLTACLHHDAEHSPVGPLVVVMLLAGLRLGEALRLTWQDVLLDEMSIRVMATKTERERILDLAVSPALVRLLELLPRDGQLVLGHSFRTASSCRLRLIEDFDAPAFQWSTRHSLPGERSHPTLRSTCGSYLTCAPSIWGSVSVYRSAAQLGHTVTVAERHYLGVIRRIPVEATSLEAAMGIETELALLEDQLRVRTSAVVDRS
jgi:integrase